MATPDNTAVNTAVARAVAGWQGMAPEWVMTLAQECDSRSMRRVAEAIGVSAALISRAVNNKHHAPLDFLRERVERMASSAQGVACPVLGEITLARCSEERKKPFSSVNPLRVQLGRTCSDCTFNPKQQGAI